MSRLVFVIAIVMLRLQESDGSPLFCVFIVGYMTADQKEYLGRNT